MSDEDERSQLSDEELDEVAGGFTAPVAENDRVVAPSPTKFTAPSTMGPTM